MGGDLTMSPPEVIALLKNVDVLDNVVTGLQDVYKQKLLPLEKEYQFHDFHSPALDDPDFDARPMVMLVGQYSTGKTTFIRYLLEQDFPGIRIGPEPTTDRFIAVMHAEQDGVIPGNALVVDPKKQFRPLSKFGNAFLNRFQCSNTKSDVLKGISIVDTPGILSGEKQRTDRGYDFIGVLEWFAERVDRILLLFDAHKLDISDEFKRSIEALRGHDDKIRIVLNKADMVDHQQLMRVYGALMWSLGKVLGTPEVARVYIGSFWDQPLRYDINRRLFEAEEQDLFYDLQSLPRNAALRKLNDLIKRARLAKVHAYIISGLRKEMPSMFGKDAKKKELIKNLDTLYGQIQREHQISPGDFPDLKNMQERLQHHDFTKFRTLDTRLLQKVDKMLAEDIAKLMTLIPNEELKARDALLKPGEEAQWCLFDPMVSAYYGKLYQKTKNPEYLKCQQLFLSRSLAAISGDDCEFGGWHACEAYYLCKGKWVSNDDTPLVWTQADLLMALFEMEASLKVGNSNGEPPLKQARVK